MCMTAGTWRTGVKELEVQRRAMAGKVKGTVDWRAVDLDSRTKRKQWNIQKKLD